MTKHYKNWFFKSYDLNANKTEIQTDVKDVKDYQLEQIKFNKTENSVDFRVQIGAELQVSVEKDILTPMAY